MWPNPQESADMVTFTEENLIRKLNFLCSVLNRKVANSKNLKKKTNLISFYFFMFGKKRDFLGIFCKTIYEDHIKWTIPSLNFSFVDKRMKIPNVFVWTREHYCMSNYDSLKLGAFEDKFTPIRKWRENSICDNFVSIKALSKKFDTWKHSCISCLKN